jgi:hypothetical protein
MARTRAWVAWAVLLFSVLPVGLGFLLVSSSSHRFDLGIEVAARLAFLPFGLVGAAIVARQPSNAVGWLCAGIGLGTGLFQFMEDYSLYALSHELPGGVALGLLGVMPWHGLLTLMAVFLPLLFPDGRLVSPRWRLLAWTAAGASVVHALLMLVAPGSLHGLGGLPDNPLGVEAAAAAIGTAVAIGFALIGIFALAAAASMVIRFRRATGVHRQQLKWFTYAAAQLAVFFTFAVLFDFFESSSSLLAPLFFLSFALVPIAIGIAVLRYRLYEIDRLINRTLVYGLLTALLGAVYAGTVLSLGQVFGGIGHEPPTWAIAGATLAVAALFQPARRRIQRVVDRRFNRRHHDAARTVEAFSTRLRDHIDLDTVTAELVTVVDQTMEPTMVQLWLHPALGGPQRPSTQAMRPSTARGSSR